MQDDLVAHGGFVVAVVTSAATGVAEAAARGLEFQGLRRSYAAWPVDDGCR